MFRPSCNLRQWATLLFFHFTLCNTIIFATSETYGRSIDLPVSNSSSDHIIYEQNTVIDLLKDLDESPLMLKLLDQVGLTDTLTSKGIVNPSWYDLDKALTFFLIMQQYKMATVVKLNPKYFTWYPKYSTWYSKYFTWYPKYSHGIQNTSHGFQNTSHGIQNTSYSIQNTSHSIQKTTYSIHNTSHGIQNTSHGIQNTSHGIHNTSMVSKILHMVSKILHMAFKILHMGRNKQNSPYAQNKLEQV